MTVLVHTRSKRMLTSLLWLDEGNLSSTKLKQLRTECHIQGSKLIAWRLSRAPIKSCNTSEDQHNSMWKLSTHRRELKNGKTLSRRSWAKSISPPIVDAERFGFRQGDWTEDYAADRAAPSIRYMASTRRDQIHGKYHASSNKAQSPRNTKPNWRRKPIEWRAKSSHDEKTQSKTKPCRRNSHQHHETSKQMDIWSSCCLSFHTISNTAIHVTFLHQRERAATSTKWIRRYRCNSHKGAFHEWRVPSIIQMRLEFGAT